MPDVLKDVITRKEDLNVPAGRVMQCKLITILVLVCDMVNDIDQLKSMIKQLK